MNKEGKNEGIETRGKREGEERDQGRRMIGRPRKREEREDK